jgi:hypothetical protein
LIGPLFEQCVGYATIAGLRRPPTNATAKVDATKVDATKAAPKVRPAKAATTKPPRKADTLKVEAPMAIAQRPNQTLSCAS